MYRRHPLNEASTAGAHGAASGRRGVDTLSSSSSTAEVRRHSKTYVSPPSNSATNLSTVPSTRQGTTTRTRTKKKRQKSAFASFYDGGGPGDDYLILGLAVLLCILIGVLSVLVIQLLQATNSTISSLLGFSSTSSRSNSSPSSKIKPLGEQKQRQPKTPLSHSPIYTIPFSMDHLGDKTDRYATLRKRIDEELPHDPERSLQRAEALRQQYPVTRSPIEKMKEAPGILASDQPNPIPYDIYDCPSTPPEHYPFHWSTLQILNHWPVDDTRIREEVHQGLCIFDYHLDYAKALAYRQQEVPFIVRGDPAVASTVERWNYPSFVDEWMGDVDHRTEYSETNHFLYWNNGPPKGNGSGGTRRGQQQQQYRQFGDGRGTPPGWKEPTQMLRMKYRDWLLHANVTEDKTTPKDPHWYFRLIGCGDTGPHGECDAGSTESLFDELTFFQPKPGQLYLVDPDEQRGIHCRFGMRGMYGIYEPYLVLSVHAIVWYRIDSFVALSILITPYVTPWTGVIAENHFDGSRNAIAVLKGARRYILSHPSQCRNLALYPKGHPSARHSSMVRTLIRSITSSM